MTELKVSDRLRENCDRYYDNEDDEWRRLGAVDKAANIVELCGALEHGRILEIGAGDGAILQRLAELDLATDYSPQRSPPRAPPRLPGRRYPGWPDATIFDGYELPYADENFDLAVLSHVVEHVEHPRRILREASRVARYVFVEVPLEDMSRLSRDSTLDRVGHINFYSPRTIRWLLRSRGLHVIRQATTNPSRATYVYHRGRRGLMHYYIKHTLIATVPSFATRHFAYHGSLVCEKSSAV